MENFHVLIGAGSQFQKSIDCNIYNNDYNWAVLDCRVYGSGPLILIAIWGEGLRDLHKLSPRYIKDTL